METLTADGEKALVGRFGPDLQVLKQHLGCEIETVEELTRITSPALQKASFKLRLEDGRRFKLRRFNSAGDWSSVVSLAPLLSELNFCRLVFAHGMAAIEQWVPGESLAAGAVSRDQLARAGEILGQVHRTELPPAVRPASPVDVDSYLNGIMEHLSALVEHGVLDSGVTRKLHERARRARPDRIDTGLIHGDFCAENMVLTDRGDIVVVDNESLRVGELDYDIARSWARWPMSACDRSAFAEGYRRHRSLEGFERYRDFWAIKALTQTIAVRLRYKKPYRLSLDALIRIGTRDAGDPWPMP